MSKSWINEGQIGWFLLKSLFITLVPNNRIVSCHSRSFLMKSLITLVSKYRIMGCHSGTFLLKVWMIFVS